MLSCVSNGACTKVTCQFKYRAPSFARVYPRMHTLSHSKCSSRLLRTREAAEGFKQRRAAIGFALLKDFWLPCGKWKGSR